MKQLIMNIVHVIHKVRPVQVRSERQGLRWWSPWQGVAGSGRAMWALLLVLLWMQMSTLHAQAQTVEWVKTAVGNGFDESYAIAVDDSGNNYVAGSFQDSATFGSTTLTSAGEADLFVAKYDTQGNVVWAQSAGGNGHDSANDIAVDGSGNSYITGNFEGTIHFGTVTLNSMGSHNIFIAKYDSNGNFLWAQQINGDGELGIGRAIDVESGGDIYITGHYVGTATFGSFTMRAHNISVYIAKYDTNGNFVWVKKAGGSGRAEAEAVAYQGGQVYVTGGFQGRIDIGSNASMVSQTSEAAYILTFASNGTFQWLRSVGGSGDDRGTGIAVDSSGNSYVTGTFEREAHMGNRVLTSAGGADIFIAKYDSAGNAVWAEGAGGGGVDYSRGISLDDDGNVYITGNIGGPDATFGSIKVINQGLNDLFVARYDNNGHFVWVRQGNSPSKIDAYGIATSSGGIYVTGQFQGTATFGSSTQLSNAGDSDIFVSGWRNDPVVDAIFGDGFEGGNFSAWTNYSSDSGDLSVTPEAALVGDLGLNVLIDDNVTIGTRDEVPASEKRYRARFYFDPNGIFMAQDENHVIFFGYSGSDLRRPVLRLELRYHKSSPDSPDRNKPYQLRAALFNDATAWRVGGWKAIMDMPHLIELDWHAAMGDGANNGSLALWIDGRMSSLITGVDNDTRRIDTTRLGAIAGIDNGTRGFYHFDAFESRRLTYIGEDPTASIAMAEPAVVTDLAEIAAWTEVDESEPEEAALLQEVLDYAEQVEQEASENDELQQEEQLFLPWLND